MVVILTTYPKWDDAPSTSLLHQAVRLPGVPHRSQKGVLSWIFLRNSFALLLMDNILHHLGCPQMLVWPHFQNRLGHPKWCNMFSINSMNPAVKNPKREGFSRTHRILFELFGWYWNQERVIFDWEGDWITWICDSSMQGKSSKHIIPNGGEWWWFSSHGIPFSVKTSP